MDSPSDKHHFAIYYNQLSSAITHTHIAITDTDMIHRIVRVLRLDSNDICILFDGHCVIEVVITTINKKEVIGTILSKKECLPIKPHITMFLPLLKRDDLEYAIYGLAELGVNEIQLVTTEKTVRAWGRDKELERLHRITIAACEQAKHYTLPLLYAPVPLSVVLSKTKNIVFADPQGDPIATIIDTYRTTVLSDTYRLLVGPEGDLTMIEKNMLRQSGVQFCSLTPTVLRACQATIVLASIFRSFLR